MLALWGIHLQDLSQTLKNLCGDGDLALLLQPGIPADTGACLQRPLSTTQAQRASSISRGEP